MPRSLHNSPAWSDSLKGLSRASRYLTPVLLDSPLGFAPAGSACGSVLMLPLGAGLLLDQLVAMVSAHSTGRTIVLAADGVTYDWKSRAASLRLLQPAALGEALAGSEPGDYLLLIEPRRWPLAGYDFAAIAERSRACLGGTYAVAIGHSGVGASERVECDATGRIRSVQRVYNPATWSGPSAGTVLCAVVPARALQGLTFTTLGELRSQLATRGLLTQDLPVATDMADLAEPAGVLTLAEQSVDALLEVPPPGLTEVRPGVFAGRSCRIAATARLIGPAILHDRVVIEAGVTVIGPALIGAGAWIGPQAVVARSVVLAGARVAPAASLCSEIVAGEQAHPATGTERPAEHLSVRAPDSCVSRHMTVADLPRRQRSARRRVELALKRAADLTLSTLGLLLLLPLLLVTAVLVKGTSRGPLFFLHRREGEAGREFGCIKFRTMSADAHNKQREMYTQNQVDGPQFKMAHDPRVTPIGAILRATNIDELPQLLNVLAGQMSLVGPRPSPFRENQICVAWRRARLSVRPGITGLWQICRDRENDADFHQWIFYDLAYVKHFSLWLDLKILFWTIVSLGGRRRVPLARLLAHEAAELRAGQARTPHAERVGAVHDPASPVDLTRSQA